LYFRLIIKMKNFVNISVVFLLICNLAAGQAKDSVNYKNLVPYDFHMAWLKSDNAMLIDVREPMEYKKNRIKDALNLPSSGNLERAADTIDKELALFVYCTTGYRSKRAAQMLTEKGFGKVTNLAGGINAWKKDGFPLDKKRLKTRTR
jgi:rhodanese-related sulfurtransferase